jgi:hypothetical protein
MTSFYRRALFVLGLAIFFQACGSDAPSGPTAGVTPTPAPSGTPPPAGTLGLACGAAPMAECAPNCCRIEGEEGQWEAHLWSAIQLLQDQQPDLFAGQRILDRDRFLREVARITEQRFGLCAKPGPNDDEVGVKTANGFSEQYDIYEQNGRLRYPGYDGTCRPARF